MLYAGEEVVNFFPVFMLKEKGEGLNIRVYRLEKKGFYYCWGINTEIYVCEREVDRQTDG